MSRMREEMIKCPKCGKESPFPIWESINTGLDPEMKKRVIDGSAFQFECPSCKKKTNIIYGFLYHQMEDTIMIHYADSDKNEEQVYALYSNGLFDDIQTMTKGKDREKYIYRIVRSRNELLEKIAIFDDELDDRIIELYKALLIGIFINDKETELNSPLLLYCRGKNGRVFELFDDGRYVGATVFKQEVYDSLHQEYVELIGELRSEEIQKVDWRWAMTFLEQLEG